MRDSFGVEVLDRGQCVALLATAQVGRIVFTHRGLPAVRPVRFVVAGDALGCLASDEDAFLSSARGNVVAFEADAVAPDLSSGWYVTVLGKVLESRNGGPAAPPSRPLKDTESMLWIPMDLVSGRRFG
ncbi:pyridoxamine 5'-phosphate oxidase family protein [Saccharomonospora sp. NPDC006951]